MPLSKSADKVQTAIQGAGMQLVVVELPDSTRTATEAAQAIGCLVGQIAKSIVFQTVTNQRPILVIASGSNRVNEAVIAEHIGEQISKANADFVQQRTGFVIGGVPPLVIMSLWRHSSTRICCNIKRFGLRRELPMLYFG
jgi:prolyl-tRNA editing enzyme YbaK/EbsC (Cys-tRNA(Pro) deacylase)